MTFTDLFLTEIRSILDELDRGVIEKMVQALVDLRSRGGRLFALGVGGNAANASHVVNDLRKLTGIEAYAPTDNVSELTARTNDEGWDSVFESWLMISRLKPNDAVLVLSVGGGSIQHNISPNLVRALSFARQAGATILGIVGRDGGYTATVADVCVVVPTCNPAHITPHTEALQSVVWHLLVTHPALKQGQTKWESMR